MVTPADVRRAALALPQVIEQDHHGIPSFRVAGRIFCTLHLDHPRIMVKLDPEDQANLAAGHPDLIRPVPGYWGRKGSTFVDYQSADADLIGMLLDLAWRRVAPQRLRPRPGRSPPP
ncbi:MAG: MmcQ/YjbR family DNA-binding protein [Caulobacteraceae bacterium]